MVASSTTLFCRLPEKLDNDAMKINSVLVSELHPKATEQDVLEMFMYCGPIQKIEIKKSTSAQGVISSTAVIQYGNVAAVQMALLLSRAIILGKAVQVSEITEQTKLENETNQTATEEAKDREEKEKREEKKERASSFSPPYIRSPTTPKNTPSLTVQPPLSQSTKTTARPPTPTSTSTFGSIFFSASSPKSDAIELTTIARNSSPNPSPTSAPPFTLFSSSPPKSDPPRSTPIPISVKKDSSSNPHSSPSQSSSPSSPSTSSTPPTAPFEKPALVRTKSTAEDLEEMLHISEKVDTVTAIASGIAQKASAEAKIFDEKYNITSKFNLLKAKALSLKNEMSEKMQEHNNKGSEK